MDPATRESEAELSQGSVVGGFVLGRKLGEGEMGEVYLATGPGADEVALKILRVPAIGRGRGVELEARFRREVALCASLRHPNIVSVIDHGVHRGLPYYVMPLLRGSDLDAWLTTTGPLRPEAATAITLQACAGLRAAHEAGIVHRDLKPANIFLDERSDGEVVAVVCDFGVAKVRDEDGSLTASGAVLGTPMFMAPEQLLDSKRVDARCDVWALGMVLYAALTGKPAFVAAKTIGDLILLLNAGVVPPIQERAPWVPPALARVVHASLLPLDRRIASVRDLENALLRGAVAGARLTRADLAPMPDDARRSVATRASLPADATELSGEGEDTVLGDLGIGSVLRVQRSPLSSSRAQTGDSIAAKGKSTADPVSVTSGDSVPAPARRRRTMALVAVAALALGGAGAFGVLGSKDNRVVAGGGVTPSAPPSTPIAAPPTMTLASAAPPPSASADVQPLPSASASASAAALAPK